MNAALYYFYPQFCAGKNEWSIRVKMGGDDNEIFFKKQKYVTIRTMHNIWIKHY